MFRSCTRNLGVSVEIQRDPGPAFEERPGFWSGRICKQIAASDRGTQNVCEKKEVYILLRETCMERYSREHEC